MGNITDFNMFNLLIKKKYINITRPNFDVDIYTI